MANILLGDFGAEVNFMAGRFTPLMLAAAKDNVELVELLFYFKADYQVQNYLGLTAIDYAIVYGSYRVLALFLKMALPVYRHFEDIAQIQI